MSDPAQVRIVNNALGHLGQEPVTDLEDAALAGSAAAVKLLRVLDQARDTVLNRHGWVCVLEYTTLTASPDLPANWRYPTAFLVPGGAQRVWEIDGDTPVSSAFPGSWGPRWQVGTIEAGDAARWIIRASKDACSGGTLDSLNIAYVRKANWASFSAHLADAISYEAAVRAAYSITGEQPSATLTKRAAEQIMVAIGIDGTQEGGQPPAAPSIPAMIRNQSR